MIGRVLNRGSNLAGLLYYLYGPGKACEHVSPHLVAGWRHPAELEPPLRSDGRRDFRRLLGLLNQPHAAMGSWGLARPVWHCSIRAAPGDKMLSDDEWAQIAGDVVDRTGLSPFGEEDDAVRWVAVRHGDDTFISSRCWLVRMGGGRGWPTTGTGCGRLAWPRRNSTGYGGLLLVIGPPRAGPPGPNRRRPVGAGWENRRGLL